MQWYNNGTAKDFVEGRSFEDRLPLVWIVRIGNDEADNSAIRSRRLVVG
jgi:hypothetical protein